MLYRKIRSYIEEYLKSDEDKILLIEGARQIGKSYIIRDVGTGLYGNYVEINFVVDDEGEKIFKNVHTTEEFYLKLSMVAGTRLDQYKNTLVFIDEIQHYPQFLTMLKFLREEHKYRFISSGSLLGITLKGTVSVPVGSVILKKMYQLDFEEFLIANDFGKDAIDYLRKSFENKQSLSQEVHDKVLGLFKRYLLVGGMPDAVNEYLATHNIVKVRETQEAIRVLYGIDASRYEEGAAKKLHIRRIYDMIPSKMENKKKRIVAKDIQNRKGDRFSNYIEEFEYLINSGISIASNAISNPKYPLAESQQKNLLKLYMNDVGMLSSQLYQYNVQPILNDIPSVNLGSVYESAVAQELKAHYNKLFYYDNKQKGEVDFIVDDSRTMSVLPIEVKSGRDYTVHSALDNLMAVPDYNIVSSIVLSNEREIKSKGNINYYPIYYVMFMENKIPEKKEDLYF
ncbi:ATP-binding protein [Bacteroides caecigallinarum]|uniref:ATP-binding protein n=1 Tax=Bacteroides caecigallinarum TaxID=1411144 RepID=UPI001F37E3F1|nr:AAA family ATPase [Bacteroides caecigallinarum]MCF2582427.1 ATP-binding protein [Bacteroides caecigallinarum]